MESAANSSTNNKPVIIGAVVIFLVVLLAAITYEFKNTKTQITENPTQKPTSVQMELVKPTESATTSTAVSTFKNGSYSAEGDYVTHVGQKHINVTLTLKDNIITDANVKNEADDQMSVHYQDKFISGYKQFVIGKSIVGLHLTKVSGSSLTPNGFNDALQKIETQAKS